MVERGRRAATQLRLAAAARRERARLQWTQEVTAERAGLNIRHYQKIERGAVNLTLKTVEQLARAFDVDVSVLFLR